MNNYVKYEYLKESIEFGNYDIMFPQTPVSKKVSIEIEIYALMKCAFTPDMTYLASSGQVECSHTYPGI